MTSNDLRSQTDAFILSICMLLEQLSNVRSTMRCREVHWCPTFPHHAAGTQAANNRLKVRPRSGSAVADMAVCDDGLRQLDLQSFEAAKLSTYVDSRFGRRKYHLQNEIIVVIDKQNVALTGRNTTGPPRSVTVEL